MTHLCDFDVRPSTIELFGVFGHLGYIDIHPSPDLNDERRHKGAVTKRVFFFLGDQCRRSPSTRQRELRARENLQKTEPKDCNPYPTLPLELVEEVTPHVVLSPPPWMDYAADSRGLKWLFLGGVVSTTCGNQQPVSVGAETNVHVSNTAGDSYKAPADVVFAYKVSVLEGKKRRKGGEEKGEMDVEVSLFKSKHGFMTPGDDDDDDSDDSEDEGGKLELECTEVDDLRLLYETLPSGGDTKLRILESDLDGDDGESPVLVVKSTGVLVEE